MTDKINDNRKWFAARHTTQDDQYWEVICRDASFCVTFSSVAQAHAVAEHLNREEAASILLRGAWAALGDVTGNNRANGKPAIHREHLEALQAKILEHLRQEAPLGQPKKNARKS